MDEHKKECFKEIQLLIMSIKQVVEKYDLEEDFICSIALGFINLNHTETDNYGDPIANMNLISMTNVEDEEELEDLLSYVVETYQDQTKKEKDTSSIDYWINIAGGNNSIN